MGTVRHLRGMPTAPPPAAKSRVNRMDAAGLMQLFRIAPTELLTVRSAFIVLSTLVKRISRGQVPVNNQDQGGEERMMTCTELNLHHDL